MLPRLCSQCAHEAVTRTWIRTPQMACHEESTQHLVRTPCCRSLVPLSWHSSVFVSLLNCSRSTSTWALTFSKDRFSRWFANSVVGEGGFSITCRCNDPDLILSEDCRGAVSSLTQCSQASGRRRSDRWQAGNCSTASRRCLSVCVKSLQKVMS